MRGIKHTFAVLLPLLWLAAASDCSADMPGKGATIRCHTSAWVAGSEYGQHGPAKDGYPLAKLMRSLNRRAGSHPGLDRASTLATVSDPRLSGLRPIGVLSNGNEAQSDLARNWQFYWRTALEPRAPSTVS